MRAAAWLVLVWVFVLQQQERDGWVDCIYLDLKKAFDRVPPKKLIWKRENIGGVTVEDLGSRRLQRERREGLNKRSRGDDNSAREPREHNKTHKKTNKKIRHNRNEKKKGKESQESKRNGRKKNIVGGDKITGAERRRTRGRNHKPGGKEMTQRRRGQGKVGQLKPSIKHLRKQNTNKLNKNIEKSKYRKKHVKNMNKLMKKKTSNTQKERRKGHKANSKIKRKRKQINGISIQMHKNKGKTMRQRKLNKDNENRRMNESKRLKMLNKVKKNKGMEDNKRGTRPKKVKGIKGKIQMENTKGKRERSKNKQIKGNVKIKKQKRKYAKKMAKGRRKDQDMNKVNLQKKILSDGRRKASKDTLGRPTMGEGQLFRQNVKSYGLVDDKRNFKQHNGKKVDDALALPDELEQPFNLKELRSATKKTKNTAPGDDKIPYNMLAKLGERGEEAFLNLINRSAKPRKSARNRREPASLSVAEKSERLRRAAVVANVGVVPPTITVRVDWLIVY
ncbi:splicing regulatory glutamine/lysine-rich protein 1-like [Procambarus clarkii]|uniref:splicing regulatory glutamine/lysine-rich protein 1-like n=1 Tax=Procambarus clarkii TaxID=6728 RepID=UPI0037432FB0